MDNNSAFHVVYNYKIEELDLEKAVSPNHYESKDCEAHFLIDIEHLRNGERESILNEKNQELSQILIWKKDLSVRNGCNSGIYIPTIKWLEDPRGYEKWQSENRPRLKDLEHGFYIIDSCQEGGHYGSYFILRKTEECKFRLLEQAGITANFLSYFGQISEAEKRDIESALQIKQAKTFAEIVDKKAKISHLEDIPELKIEKGKEKWIVYKNVDEEIRKSFLEPEIVQRVVKQVSEFMQPA